MADSTIIQEFLAELGFKVDQKSLGDFTKALKANTAQAAAFGKQWGEVAEGVGKGVGGMALGFVGAAVTIVGAVLRMSAALDQLYFASRRLSSTSQQIEALRQAAARMGLAPGAAESGVAAIQERQLQMTPAAFARQANAIYPGAGVTATDTPAQAYAKIMNRIHAGITSGDARTRQRAVALIGAIPGLTDIGTAELWDPQKAAAAQAQVAKQAPDLDQAAKRSDDLQTSLKTLGETMKLMLTEDVNPLLGGMTQLSKGIGGLAGALSGLNVAVSGWLNHLIGGGLPPAVTGPVKRALGGAGGAPPVDTSPIGQGGLVPRPALPAGAHVPKNLRQNNPGNLRDTRTGLLATFPTWEAGVAAAERQLRRDYDVHGLHTIRQLIAGGPHWPGWAPVGPENSPATVAGYIKLVATALGVGPDQQVNYASSALIGRTLNAIVAEESGIGKGAILGGRGGPLVGAQTITVNVNGAQHPTAVAREVVGHLKKAAVSPMVRGLRATPVS